MFAEKPARVVLVAALLVTAGLAGCAGTDDPTDGDDGDADDGQPDAARAQIVGTDGEQLGTVLIAETDDEVVVAGGLSGLEPGFHGFHLHETGACEPDFAAAGGHHAPGNTTHGDHAGDMPVLLATENGTAQTAFQTDRLDVAELLDDDGTAVIVHESPDNYANIPERYGGPDEDTNATGDAGGRAACGALEGAEATVDIEPGEGEARADLVDQDGEDVGEVTFSSVDEGVFVTANVTGLEAGFHGFHLHDTGACEPDFQLAGNHWAPDGNDHGEHAGDMPVLLATENGTAQLRFLTDRFAIDDLDDVDGTAVIVHANADNYANVPDRYDGPDDETRSGGDAGPRIACGPIE